MWRHFRGKLVRSSVLLFVCLGPWAVGLGAQAVPLNQRVLVVYNRDDRDSKQVAQYYAKMRSIPAANLCAIQPVRTDDSYSTVAVTWTDFDSVVRKPLQKCLDAVGRKKILYIVIAYHTPYRIDSAPKGFGVSLDQFIVDIWDETGAKSPAANPYYAPAQSRAGILRPFVSLAAYRQQPDAKLIYSVWRLDAATPALATGLVDKAIEAERSGLTGQACIDRRYGKDISGLRDSGYEAGDWDLHRAAELLRQAGVPVLEDSEPVEFGTPPAPTRCDDAIFYAGWYSLNNYNDAFAWKPGAIGIHVDSASAENPRGGRNWSANAILKGITVTGGALTEPYLEALPHPDGIVHDLLAGANVGDAFLRSTPMLRWMIIYIGDPLYRPRFKGNQRNN